MLVAASIEGRRIGRKLVRIVKGKEKSSRPDRGEDSYRCFPLRSCREISANARPGKKTPPYFFIIDSRLPLRFGSNLTPKLMPSPDYFGRSLQDPQRGKALNRAVVHPDSVAGGLARTMAFAGLHDAPTR